MSVAAKVASSSAANAAHVLEARYLRRDANRRVVGTAQELFERVARAVAQGELVLGKASDARRGEAEFLDLLTSRKFLPNSPTLMNAGTPLGQLSACFVKTINLAAGATREEIEHGIWRAWELGLKGVTFFRFGSRATQVIHLGAGESPQHYEHGSRCDRDV